jgi:CRP-like cAMP-binding protein
MDVKVNQELIELLGEISMFQDLNAAERAEFAVLMTPQTYEAGKELFREGDPGGQMFIIASGAVEVQKQRSHGAGRIVIARFERGGVIGEMSLLDRMPRSASVVSAQTSKAYVFTQPALEELMATKQGLAMKLLKGLAVLLSLRLRNTSGWFADVF